VATVATVAKAADYITMAPEAVAAAVTMAVAAAVAAALLRCIATTHWAKAAAVAVGLRMSSQPQSSHVFGPAGKEKAMDALRSDGINAIVHMDCSRAKMARVKERPER
jgi:hypothetical protein